MPNLKKLFKPDIMFNDFIKSCWSDNIKVIDKKIPVNKDLKAAGEYALSIEPLKNKSYFVFSLPINKSWLIEDFTKWRNPYLTFDIISCDKFKLTIQTLSDTNEMLQKQEFSINEIEDWNKIEMQINKKSNIKLISFSGSSQINNILIKNIVILDI